MTRAAGLVLLTALFTAGCETDSRRAANGNDGEAAPTSIGDVVDAGSPAGPGSGEPWLAAGRDGTLLMSWIEPGAQANVSEVRFARYVDGAWHEPRLITASPELFINWADFPSILELSDGRLAAHWLQKSSAGRYSYDAWTTVSADGGATWSTPAPLHTDGTATEHGFVSLFEHGGILNAIWLDGRRYARGEGGGPATEEMTLQHTTVDAAGVPSPERLVDGRVCDCCQTDAAITTDGPIIVYRDRTENEIRDIVVSRLQNGAWTPGRTVYEDGWQIPGCPVNGPAIAASGEDVVVAWFTAAGEVPIVRAAFSADAGESFGAPARVDLGNPVGRVDVLMLSDGSALVSWLERTDDGTRVLARRVTAGGTVSQTITIGESSEERASGFPRIAAVGQRVFFAFTSPEQGIRVVSSELTER